MKLTRALGNDSSDVSHPEWVRGLKLNGGEMSNAATVVAPRVGAWIETSIGIS